MEKKNQEGVAAGVFLLSQNDQQDQARPTQSKIEQQINLFVYVCHVWSFLVFLVIVGIDVRTQIISNIFGRNACGNALLTDFDLLKDLYVFFGPTMFVLPRPIFVGGGTPFLNSLFCPAPHRPHTVPIQ